MIPFTQYLRPHGRPREIQIERPLEIEQRAQDLIKRGVRFEAEQLTTGEVSLTAHYNDEDIAIEICENGPEVPPAVDRLVQSVKLPT